MLSFSFAVIFISTILFIIVYVLGVLFIQENYNMKRIKISNIQESWNILSYTKGYHTWWRAFKKINEDNLTQHYSLVSNIQYRKISFKISNKNKIQLWSFYFQPNEDYSQYFLSIYKEEISAKWFLSRFYFKYIKNNRDIGKFIKDFKNISSK